MEVLYYTVCHDHKVLLAILRCAWFTATMLYENRARQVILISYGDHPQSIRGYPVAKLDLL